MEELGSDNADQELTLSLLGSDQDALDQIKAALQRIEDGSYGECDTCGVKKCQSHALKLFLMRHNASDVPHNRKATGLSPLNEKSLGEVPRLG